MPTDKARKIAIIDKLMRRHHLLILHLEGKPHAKSDCIFCRTKVKVKSEVEEQS